jgi:hypothetical protein
MVRLIIKCNRDSFTPDFISILRRVLDATKLIPPSMPVFQDYTLSDGSLDYGKLMLQSCTEIKQAIMSIESDIGKEGINVFLPENWKPCPDCSKLKKTELDPYAHLLGCQNCTVSVTHSKLGPLIQMKILDRIVTVDLIPVWPIKAKSNLILMGNVMATLLDDDNEIPERVPYLLSLMARDVLLPEAFEATVMEEKPIQVALKIVNYNCSIFIIRPGQDLKVDEFHRNKVLFDAYIIIKALIHKYQLEIKSFLSKKILTSPYFVQLTRHIDNDVPKLVFNALQHGLLKPGFQILVNYEKWGKREEEVCRFC